MTQLILKSDSGEIIKNIPLDVSKTLLEQLEAVGAEIPNACSVGICWSCMCEIESWWKQIDKNYTWEWAFPVDDNEVMTCIAWGKKGSEDITLKMMF